MSSRRRLEPLVSVSLAVGVELSAEPLAPLPLALLLADVSWLSAWPLTSLLSPLLAMPSPEEVSAPAVLALESVLVVELPVAWKVTAPPGLEIAHRRRLDQVADIGDRDRCAGAQRRALGVALGDGADGRRLSRLRVEHTEDRQLAPVPISAVVVTLAIEMAMLGVIASAPSEPFDASVSISSPDLELIVTLLAPVSVAPLPTPALVVSST